MATKTFKVSLSLDNPRTIQTGIKVRSFDKQSIKIAIDLIKDSQVYQIPTDAQIKISLLKLARQEQKIILDVPFTSTDSIDWIVPEYLDGYQGAVRVGVYLIVGTENIDVGYFNITSSVSDIDSAAEEFTESVLQGWAIEDLTALLPKFQAVLDETTGKDVISAPEIILARNGEADLKTRLDKDQQQVTAQLAQTQQQKADKNEVYLKSNQININDFDESTRQAFLEAQSVDVNYVLGEGNVMPFNTTFFKHGKNLFNKDTAIQDKSISTFSGNLAANIGHVTSDFIKIDPSKAYAISPIPANVRVAFYDNAKENIAGTGVSGPTNPIFPPVDAVFLRYSSTNQVGRQLEEGASPTAFEPYVGYYYDEGYFKEGSITPEKLGELGSEVFSDNSLTPEKMTFFKKSKNLYNKETSIPGKSISVASGNLATNANNTTSDFISVESGEYYSLSPRSPIIRLAFYDSYKNFISGLSDPTNPILVPENGAYVRYSYSEDLEDVRQFEKGQIVTSYEPYYEAAFDVATIRDYSIPLSKIKGGIPSGDSSVNADEIIVDMNQTNVTFYIKGSNPGSNRYLNYRFKKEERDFDEIKSNGNLNAWRLVDLFEVERIGEFSFTNVYQESFTTDGVWEFALKEKGQPQFMGGGHGNEVMTDVFMLVDGVQKSLGVSDRFTCKNIQFVQKSTIYRVFTQTPLANVVKAYDVTAKDGIKITAEFDWIESIVLEGGSFFPMLPIKRTLADNVTQITDRFVRDSDYDIKDISTTASVVSSGASEPLTGITESNMWGQESGLSVKITSLEKAKENQTMYISPSSLFNKFYYQIIGKSDYTVDVGEKMKSTVLFKFNTIN